MMGGVEQLDDQGLEDFDQGEKVERRMIVISATFFNLARG